MKTLVALALLLTAICSFNTTPAQAQWVTVNSFHSEDDNLKDKPHWVMFCDRGDKLPAAKYLLAKRPRLFDGIIKVKLVRRNDEQDYTEMYLTPGMRCWIESIRKEE